ncbi:malate dehydrogenase, cytoplasmic-like [Syzygium oleosum]|uniref:malate dehydrogenase, cytoplasmic-like n=1 Tax=Syzygium oleosum TaxID=219896 RepID=UPI0024B9EC21|nr:malate dehydrogenase, cytoplasmic-like [Syzygium oleosum]
MVKQAVRILVTDAGGLVACDLVRMIALGDMLGPDQPMILHLFHRGTLADADALQDLKIVLVQSPHPLVEGIIEATDAAETCNGVEFAMLIGMVPKKTSRESLVNNYRNYKLLADALENYAAANCKVLVIAYPVDSLASTLKKFAPSIPPKNITCLTRSYHNCALGHISDRVKVSVGNVKNVIIWGNHSLPLHFDVNHATVDRLSGEYTVRELINDDAWLNGEFITYFQPRAALSIKVGRDSGAFLLARAACCHIHDWVLGTPKGTWVSMGVFTDGSYNVPKDLIFSFPVTSRNGEWTIVQGIENSVATRKKMDSTAEELMKEHLLTLASIERYFMGSIVLEALTTTTDNSGCVKFKKDRFPQYPELCIVFGGTYATGDHATGNAEDLTVPEESDNGGGDTNVDPFSVSAVIDVLVSMLELGQYLYRKAVKRACVNAAWREAFIKSLAERRNGLLLCLRDIDVETLISILIFLYLCDDIGTMEERSNSVSNGQVDLDEQFLDNDDFHILIA